MKGWWGGGETGVGGGGDGGGGGRWGDNASWTFGENCERLRKCREGLACLEDIEVYLSLSLSLLLARLLALSRHALSAPPPPFLYVIRAGARVGPPSALSLCHSRGCACGRSLALFLSLARACAICVCMSCKHLHVC